MHFVKSIFRQTIFAEPKARSWSLPPTPTSFQEKFTPILLEIFSSFLFFKLRSQDLLRKSFATGGIEVWRDSVTPVAAESREMVELLLTCSLYTVQLGKAWFILLLTMNDRIPFKLWTKPESLSNKWYQSDLAWTYQQVPCGDFCCASCCVCLGVDIYIATCSSKFICPNAL